MTGTVKIFLITMIFEGRILTENLRKIDYIGRRFFEQNPKKKIKA